MNKIYNNNGYLNMDYIYNIDVPFIFIVGGRGIGKTYGAIKYCIENKQKFILMRRTQTQADLIGIAEMSPLKAPCEDMGIVYKTIPMTKQCKAFYIDSENENEFLCYTIALSTFANVRGFSASNIDVLLYDEFIPERHERPIKQEGQAFLNCYETINRNRELQGRKPLKVICMANAFDLANELFTELGIVTKAENMSKRGQEITINKERGYSIILPNKSPISRSKMGTALYKLTGDNTDFARMSIGNEFSDNKGSLIMSKPIKEYRLLCIIGELAIYRHKSLNEFYATPMITGTTSSQFSTSESDKKRFRRSYAWLWKEYLDNRIIFESYLMESLFTKAFA